MEFKDVVNKRREITSFLDREISSEVMEEILNQAILSPTGNNLPSREFIVVKKRETLDQLSSTTPYVKWLKEAQSAIIITGNPKVSKYWLQDASIASSFIWLAAVNEGVGCAFGAIFNISDDIESEQREQFVRTVLNIPQERQVVAILGLGYQKEEPNKKEIHPKETIVHYGTF
ncbi:nitroreductase [Metabacillus crassostreae]|uniref:nitroreductase family protein n=1 Tax=Metabacillus crassostreae TaxID=929098 RepID=UPI001EF966FE|nr:nitroreductase family protein [Metabacillus crassostreae]MBM7605555.1 nitroreductase [Metabacillus crassostreae]